MELGDDNDKIRRNLVMLSTAVLLGAAFDVKIDSSAKILGIAGIEHPAPWKLWGALIIIVCYMLVRYRFDKTTENLWDSTRTQWWQRATTLVGEYLAWGILKDIRKRGTSKKLSTSYLLDAMHAQLKLKIPGRDSPITTIRDLRILKTALQHRGRLWNGEHTFNFSFEQNGGGRSGTAQAGIVVPVAVRPLILIATTLGIAFYSKTGIDLLFPYLLGFAAIGVSLYKLLCPLL